MLTEQQIFNFATGFRATHETAFCTGVQYGARWANEQNAAEIEDLKFELDKTKVEVRQLLDALAKCGAYDRQDIMAKIDTILEKYDRK